MSQVRTCDECTRGIVNDDWTHLDYAYDSYPDGYSHHQMRIDADQRMASIRGTLEIFGWLTLVGKSADNGCFTCPICSDIQYGGGSLFSGVTS